MSDSGSSSSSSASDSPRNGSPEPESVAEPEVVPGQEATASTGNENQSSTNADLLQAGDGTPIAETSAEPDSAGPEPDPDAEPLHITWTGPTEIPTDDTLPQPSLAIDFVVVPGIYGNWYSEYDSGPGSGSSLWVSNYAESLNSDSRILRYEYDSRQLLSGRKSREAIRQCALRLLRAVSATRRRETKKRLIMFVTHDIGGIVVKDALAIAAKAKSSWMEIAEMARIVVFTGCPHRSHGGPDMEDRLSRFLFGDQATSSAMVHPSVASIAGLTAAVIEVNGLFIESKIPLRNNIISIYAEPYQNRMNSVFDEFCGTLGIPLEKRVADPMDDSLLTGHLTGWENDLNTVVDSEQFKFERKLLSLASPVYPLHTEASSYSFLSGLAEYEKWLDYTGTQILYIHGKQRVREAAEQIYHTLDSMAQKDGKRAIVLYFSFDRWDVRCDSIRDMLSTFLAQIICHYPRLSNRVKALSTLLELERGWTEADLVYWFERFRFTDEIEHVMCVINYFDECTKGSRKPFLDNFSSIAQATERPWKVVITSHTPGALTDELSGPSCATLDLAESGLETYDAEGVDRLVKHLITLRPELHLQESILREQLQQIEKADPLVRHIICEQARVRPEWPDEISTSELIGSLELNPTETQDVQDDQTLQKVLDWVFQKIPDQTTLQRILSWLLYSVRPLTLSEFATIAYLSSDQDNESLASPSSSEIESFISKVQVWLAGIVEIDHNEVKVRSPRLRNILMGSEAEEGKPRYLWDKIKFTAHSDIARLCLEYLSRPKVLEIVGEFLNPMELDTFETPTFTDRSTLCTYAVQAWTYHFSLGSPKTDLPLLLSHLKSSDLEKRWARAYWSLSNPVMRNPVCLESLFPIFAGLGLLDVVKPQNETAAGQGLCEAASRGQAKIVQRLLDKVDFSESVLLDALISAGACGDEKMMLGLLEYIVTNSTDSKKIAWPPILIFRAAWLGLDRFAGKLLDLGCSADPEVEWMKYVQASPLHHAARNAHAACVQVLIKHNADVNFRAMYGRTPLHVVASQGLADISKILVEEGKSDIETLDEDGFSAIYFASLWGHHQVVQALLELGADPNMRIEPTDGPGKWSPLVVAADDGFKQCVQFLLDKKANPNIVGPTDIGTPLRYAAVKGHLEICELLIARGAEPNSPLINPPILIQIITDYTATQNQLEIFDLLLEHNADVNAKDSDGVPVLVHAAKSNQSDAFIRRLVDHDADVNILDSDNNGALYHLAENGHQYLVELLLEKGAAVNQVSTGGTTPLYFAVPEPEVVRILLEKGADPDLGRSQGFTALMFAAWFNHIDTLKYLLKHNVSLEQEYNGDDEELKGWTALNCAVSYGSEEVVRILAEHGADLQHRSAAGVPAIHSAARGETLPAMLEFPSKIDLDQLDNDGSSALHLTISTANFKRLVNAGAKLEIQDKTAGDTPLTYVAYYDNMECAEYLLKHGVDVNLASPCYGAPLHQACRRSNWEMVKMLVEHGADVNQACEGLPGTPIQAALIRYDAEPAWPPEDFVNYLITHGASVTAEGGLLRFPINAAALKGSPSLINLLIEKGANVDVRDGMGRQPIMNAAFHGIDNFQTILDLNGDVNARDEMGRTALHWAAQPGRAQVVEKILSLGSDAAVDAPDIDGWTALCWAARGTDSWLDEEVAGEPQEQIKVMKLLLEHGANRSVVVSVGGQKWTPLKIARFSDQSTEVIELLENGLGSEDTDKKSEAASLEDADLYQSKAANIRTSYCDACRCNIRGFGYHCKTCYDFDFCFKCYTNRHILHAYPEHSFEVLGPEFQETPESEAGDSSSDTSASSDSDSD